MNEYKSMGIELSVNDIIKSALVNLSRDYATDYDYIHALFESIDYYELRNIASTKVNELVPTGEKESLVEVINNETLDCDDIYRAIRRRLNSSQLIASLFGAIVHDIINQFFKDRLVFEEKFLSDEVESIGNFFDLNITEKRMITFFYAWEQSESFANFWS